MTTHILRMIDKLIACQGDFEQTSYEAAHTSLFADAAVALDDMRDSLLAAAAIIDAALKVNAAGFYLTGDIIEALRRTHAQIRDTLEGK